MNELKNLKIEGMGSCYGGEYNEVRLEGMTSVKDDLKCATFSAEGMCKCEGQIDAVDMKVEGTFKACKDIRAKRFNAEGYFRAKNCSVNADEINADGFISCKELSADIISIEGVCHADKIFGESISINPTENASTGFGFIFKSAALSKAELIECTELEADALSADIIRANRVKLGKDCKVNILEYSDTADIHPDAKINKLIKI